jgi:hypothetical protein
MLETRPAIMANLDTNHHDTEFALDKLPEQQFDSSVD